MVTPAHLPALFAVLLLAALPAPAWVDAGRIVADFRDETFTLDGATGAFTVESRRAPGRVYVRGRVQGLGEVTGAQHVFDGDRTDRDTVVVAGVCGGRARKLTVVADYDGVALTPSDEGLSFDGTVVADAPAGDDAFAVAADRRPDGLAAACGPAVPQGADAVYCRRSDALLSVAGAELGYAAEEGASRFAARGPVRFACRRGFLARRFNVNYRPINPDCDLKTPPVGWMTWYAVKFGACDAVVMRNARSFAANFRGYTDEPPLIWVDWEWGHEKMRSCGAEGQDALTPRPVAYPRGLRAVADDLKALGLRPALWVSFVNDVRTNALWRAHPQWILGEYGNWSGAVWGDPTAPGFCEEYIPALAKLYRDDWGFEAFKWDTLPNANWAFAYFRDRLADPALSPADVYRRMVAAGRRALGPNVYLEACAGITDREILEALDFFDAARVGDDVFDWDCFVRSGVRRVLRYYPLHGTAFWADADNLVLRPEFSTLAQARTRVTAYGLAGVPITVGDDFAQLDAPRLEMLRRVMPVVPTHPAALDRGSCPSTDLDMTVDVARDFGAWQLRAWSNLATNKVRRVAFAAPGKVVWDFWNDRLLEETAFDVAPGDTRLVRVAPIAAAGPTLVSVSRHITQGAYELKACRLGADGARGVVRCPGGETVKVTFLLPEGASVRAASHPYERAGRILRLRVGSDARADVPFALELGD